MHNCVLSSNLPLFHFSMSSDYLCLSFIFPFLSSTPPTSNPSIPFQPLPPPILSSCFFPFPILSFFAYPTLPILPPSPAPTRKQYTVAVIKPDAVANGVVEEILAQVEAAGLEVLCREERTLTKEEAEDFYKQHEGSVSLQHNDCIRSI